MLADIMKQGKKAGRQFGIKVSGTMEKHTAQNLIAAVRPVFDELQASDFSTPVLLFLFNMPADDGYLFWVIEPGVGVDNQTLMRSHILPLPLTTMLINDMITKIDLWYDVVGTRSPSSIKERNRSGREALNYIIDKQIQFEATHNKPAALARLPLVFAYDLAKLTKSDIGDLSRRVFLEGVRVFEKVGLLGMKVKIENDLKDVILE